MKLDKIIINETIMADKNKVWDYYTLPEHITQWNFADQSWHCPSVTNDMKIGGTYKARMEAKDKSFGFDFEAVYTKIEVGHNFTFCMGNRFVMVEFKEIDEHTEVTITFDPEDENPIELQKQGWQAILINFKKYTELL